MLNLTTPISLALHIADCGLCAAIHGRRHGDQELLARLKTALTAVRTAKWPDTTEAAQHAALGQAMQILAEVGRAAEVEAIEEQMRRSL